MQLPSTDIPFCSQQLAALTGLGLLTLPESPRWLLLDPGREPEAAEALSRTLGSKAGEKKVAAELAAIKGALANAAGGGEGDVYQKIKQLFTNRAYRQPLLVGSSLMLFQQITGQPSVLYYAAQIFRVRCSSCCSFLRPLPMA